MATYNPAQTKINDYFLIGDLHSAALVSNKGSIDWLCLPHFDSPSIFARLLDANGGLFAIETDGYDTQARYVGDTAILETILQKKEIQISVRDFMVPQPKFPCREHYLVRKITGVQGSADVKFRFSPRPEYANVVPELQYDAVSQCIDVPLVDKATLRLYLPQDAQVVVHGGTVRISIPISQGSACEIRLEYVRSGGYEATKFTTSLEEHTERFWKQWLAKGTFFPFCVDVLKRSAITLKLLQFYPTGAIVAAPTTSLPEVLGGERNWDYRYVWIRDATFSLYAFHVLGFDEEAEKFFTFLQSITKTSEEEHFEIALMYTIEGKPVPRETELTQLAGYQQSRPVRIGNNAAQQFQLDVYGALIDSHYLVAKREIRHHSIHKEMILSLVKQIEKKWRLPDRGIWEVRTGDQQFIYSKIMAWVGVNRALRLQNILGMSEAEVKKLEALEEEIKVWIWTYGFDEQRKIFLQHPDTQHQDATNFLFVLLQFLDKKDPLTKTILENTRQKLVHNKVFMYRYKKKDGLAGDEGAFLLCSFWYISALAIVGETEEAHKLFHELLLQFGNNGLLSEEIAVETGEYLGNYPQAFSHLGLIIAAYYIQRYTKDASLRLPHKS